MTCFDIVLTLWYNKYLNYYLTNLSIRSFIQMIVNGYDIKPGADLCEANLMRAKLNKANMSYANLYKANLWGADLRGVDLTSADMGYANLRQADLSNANLNSADLRGADLREANLSGVNMCGVDLTEADLRLTNLIKANLLQATLLSTNLQGAYLDGCNLLGVDLEYARLRDVKTILSFEGSRQPLIIHYSNKYKGNAYIQIGCIKDLSLKEWLKRYEVIGRENGYSDFDIKLYHNFLLVAKQWVAAMNKQEY